MKKQALLKFALLILLFVLPTSILFSQNKEKEKEKTIKIKMVKEGDDGKTISIDTTINLTEEMNFDEINEMIQTITLDMDLPDSIKDIMKTIDIHKCLDKDDTCKTKVIVKVLDGETYIKKDDGNIMIICDSISMKDIDSDDKEIHKITIMKSSENGEPKISNAGEEEIQIDIDTEDDGVMKIKMISKDGEEVIMEKNIDVDEILKDVEKLEGDTKVNVIKTSSNGKTIIIATKVILVDLDENDISTLKKSGVKDIKNNKLKVEEMNFYPNPNNGKFKLSFELDSKDKTVVSIFDESGKRVYLEEIQDFTGIYNKEIDLSGEPKGIYFINVNQDKKSLTKKIIVN
ncbi:MAG: T9SS type A sorting domain-containing protein [Saprospiraceae bacterium]|nr:T9SS type A sorting domain-containing protein [Saprospiraceae bacterium]